ncbi:MAG: metal ABC transporter ATP-binding protein [Myxococcota bacterium]
MRKKTDEAAPKDDGVAIRLTNVSIGYDRPLLKPLSLEIRKSDFWGIVGPNGAGKTTLVKTILGLIQPLGGELKFPAGVLRFGYVPQRHSLNPRFPLTALDVALMGRFNKIRAGRAPSKEDREETLSELKRLELAELAYAPYFSLSGGQQQRVLIARALASRPDVLVLDEPTSGLDLSGEAGILAFLKKLHSEQEITIIMIGHHIGKVIGVSKQLCLINKDTGLFEAGDISAVATKERLSELYERTVEVEKSGDFIHVYIIGERDG